MKQLLASTLLLTLSFLAKAQETETPKFFNAADPTQLYTNLNFNSGINFTTRYDDIEPDNWVVNLGGDFAIKKFNFGFNIPFSNNGNYQTTLGNIDIHAGFQPFNREGVLKSSLIQIGMTRATGYDFEYGVDIFSASLASNTFYFNYIASLKLSDKISVYPSIGIKQSKFDSRTATYFPDNDSTYSSPILNQLAYTLGLSASYQFSDKHFIQLNSNFESGAWKLDSEEQFWTDGPTSIKRHMFFMSLKYQYAIRNNFQVYLQLQNNFGDTFEDSQLNGWNYDTPGFLLGVQYFLK